MRRTPVRQSTQIAASFALSHYHLCYSPLCVFPEIALQKLNEQKDIFTLGDWLVPALIGKMAVKSICFGAQSFDHFSAQTQLCSKNYLCGFSYSKGLSYDQTTP